MSANAATYGVGGLVVAAVLGLLGLLALVGALIGGEVLCVDEGGGGGAEPSAAAVGEIPESYLRLYREMGSRYDVDWTILAAIGAQESGHGVNTGRSSAGCVGVMQLCGAFTQRPIAQDGNGDGDIELGGVDDPADSIASAANGLKKLKHAPGIGASYAAYRQPVCDYYGACADVNANFADEVMARAVQYGFSGAGAPAPTDPSTGPSARGPERTLLEFGDARSVVGERALRASLPGWTVETDGRTRPTTADGAAQLRSRDALASVVVIHLGVGDDPRAPGAFRRQVLRVLDVVGANRCVVWSALAGDGFRRLNAVLRDVARSRAELRVVSGTEAIGDAARACVGGLDGGGDAGGPCAEAGDGGPLQGIGSPDAQALRFNPRITFANPLQQLSDLQSGRISPRLVSLLATIAERHTITITALASDHGPRTNHEAGRGVDIGGVDGESCLPADRVGGCWALVTELDRTRGCLRPTELFYFAPGPGAPKFAYPGHDDHVHVGYDGPLGPKRYAPDTPPCSQQALAGT